MSSCAEIREALSARVDDEATDAELLRIAVHLPACSGCRAYDASLDAVSRRVVVAVASEVPDLSAAIVRRTAPTIAATAERRTERRRHLRAVLTLAGIAQVVLATAALTSAGAHGVRDLAAFELALGLSFLVTARHPRYAVGLVPVVALVTAVSLVVGGIELLTGQARLLAELTHLLPLLATPVVRALAHDHDAAAVRPVASR